MAGGLDVHPPEFVGAPTMARVRGVGRAEPPLTAHSDRHHGETA
jgi:hypothetical protein